MMCFQQSIFLLAPNQFLSGFHQLEAYSSPLNAIFLDFEIWSLFGNWSGKSIMTSQILSDFFLHNFGDSRHRRVHMPRILGHLNLWAINIIVRKSTGSDQ